MKCTGKEWDTCQVEKMGCPGCYYDDEVYEKYNKKEKIMEIRVYLHRTKKKQFEVADCFSVFVDLDKLPDDKKDDIDFINEGFKNDCQRIARTRECVQKFGTGYLSFMRPQYEGPEDKNGNDTIKFSNKEMLFVKKRKPRKKKEVATEEVAVSEEK